jgi:hypothetical protein
VKNKHFFRCFLHGVKNVMRKTKLKLSGKKIWGAKNYLKNIFSWRVELGVMSCWSG